MENETNEAQGIWDSTTPYAKKIKFEQDKPVLITFPNDFTKPKEFPSTTPGEKGFVVFDIKAGEDQEDSVIMTSSITMLRNLKTHEPLAGKSVMITKKNVGGKNFFYVEDAIQFKAREDATPKEEPSSVDTEDAGIAEDSTI